ncbi:glycoside-pentoside-hexuronide (GPH):cation symporter [Priestia filamentosa]|uniref:glycoside-pentoside-hexuronide (GPH):cation symporter n=1 Tax=Priestia filamentosa TaxID=1402861 RepID=UPI002E1E5901|nr:glycoside-pentoside-hexuronide (GPH):cation symporter [Priestia filamentosa]MED3728375.1 glycoside-pentoside-hexuronide (GPH):cation symporter [Priestia filamentosa]
MEEKAGNIINTEIELPTQKLAGVEKVSYGLGNLSANLLITTANSFIVFFYTEIAGIAAATVGTLLLIARIFDGVTDLGMGMIVDKTKSKYGKARPWLLWMAIPYILAMVLLFTSPEFSQTGKSIYAFITYILAIGIIYTMISVPYNSMLVTLSQDQIQRGQLSISRAAFGLIGGMLVGVITLPAVSFLGGGKNGWMFIAIIYGIVGALSYLIVFKNTKERVDVETPEKKDTVPIKHSVKALVKNKYWLLTLSIIILSFVGAGLSGIGVYYAKYILGDPNLMAVLTVVGILPTILMMFFMDFLFKKFGKRNLAMIGGVVSIIGALIIWIDPESISMVSIGSFIRGLGGAPLGVAAFVMLADSVEYGEWKTGIRTEGLALSAGTFGEKVGTGIGGMVLGALMGLAGYVGGQAEQTVSALTSIKLLFIHVPIILSILSIILLYFYKLDKKYPTIIKELNERKI